MLHPGLDTAELALDVPLTIRHVDGMAGVGREEWNAMLSPGEGPLEHDYLAAWEHAELDGLTPQPIVARAGRSRPLAGAPAYFYDLDLAFVQRQIFPRAVRALRRLWPNFLVARMFEIGCPSARACPLVCDPEVEDREAMEGLLRTAVEDAMDGGAQMVIVQDFPSTDGAAGDALRAVGFAPVPILPTLVVDTPYETFEEYLGAMRASYRRRARRCLKATEALRVERVRDFSALSPELARLWRLVWERANEVKREVLPEAFFRDVARLEQVSVLLLRRPDDSIASFALLMEDEPWLHFLYTGFEEEAGRDEGAYFRLLYEIVRAGVEGGFEKVNLGITTAAPKLDVGGRPVPLYAWMYHRRRRLQPLFAALARGPFGPEAVEPRHVFKEQAA